MYVAEGPLVLLLYTIEQFMLYNEHSFIDYWEKHNTRKTEFCHTMLYIKLVN